MNWTKKYNHWYNRYEHYDENNLIIIFKNGEGYKYRFCPQVIAKDFSGYATSIHFWKTLKGIKLYLENNTHFMEVKISDEKDYFEYKIINSKIINCTFG